MNTSRIAFAIAASLFVSTGAWAEGTAGVAAAVNPDALGTPPSAPQRALGVGTTVFQNEHIVTKAGGQAQMLFEDGSAVTLGPDADLTLDSFVYDPNARKGKLGLKLTSGALRFVGGQLSKDGSTEIVTPSATIGIRGGIALVSPGQVTFLFGDSMSVTGKDGSSTIVTRPGFTVFTPFGQPVSPPVRVDPKLLSDQVASFEGKSGSKGGVNTPPTDTDVKSSFKNSNGDQPPGPPVAPQIINPFDLLGSGDKTGQTLQNRIVQDFKPLVVTPPPAPDEHWNGFAAGIADQISDMPQGYLISNVNGLPTDVVINTHPAKGTVDATLGVTIEPIGGYCPPCSTATVVLGGGQGRSAYVDNGNFALTNSIDGTARSVVNVTGYNSSEQIVTTPTTLTDDQVLFLFAGTGGNKITVVNVPTGFQFCDCQYAHWGFWGGSAVAAGDSSKTVLAAMPGGTWVAGVLTAPSDLPAQGGAEYTGHIIGAFKNGTSPSYLAAGKIVVDFSFTTPNGSFNVSGLDGYAYAGFLTANRTSGTFSGSGSQQCDCSATMLVNGAFFGPKAAEVGGQFKVTSYGNYSGAGIFAAKGGAIPAATLTNLNTPK